MQKKMKLNNILLVLIVTLMLNNCSSIKDTLTGQNKKKSADEFLIDKKNPLVIPPEFSKLPVPKEEDETSNEKSKEKINLSKVLEKSKKKTKKISSDGSLEKSISNILKKN